MNGEDENQALGSSILPMKKRFSSEHDTNESESKDHLPKKFKLEGIHLHLYEKKFFFC